MILSIFFLQSGRETNKFQHISALHQYLFHAHTSLFSLNLKVWIGWSISILSCKLDSDVFYLPQFWSWLQSGAFMLFSWQMAEAQACKEPFVPLKPSGEKRHRGVLYWRKRITWELTMEQGLILPLWWWRGGKSEYLQNDHVIYPKYQHILQISYYV